MILQDIISTRFLPILIWQMIVAFIFIFIAYKILRRNRNRITYSASSFYFIMAIAFILNAIYFTIRVNPLVLILYFITAYLFFFSAIFLITFNILLLQSEKIFTKEKQLIIILVYGILLFCSLFLPEGIAINENTNWAPQWSWSLLIIMYIFTISLIIVPFFYTSIKIYSLFKDDNLKKRWKYYISGFIGFAIILSGNILYCTWNNATFRTILTFVTITLVLFAVLIYYGIGQNL